MRPTPLAYLMKNLNDKGDFSKSWTPLSDDDKNTLKRWAEEEMEALGL